PAPSSCAFARISSMLGMSCSAFVSLVSDVTASDFWTVDTSALSISSAFIPASVPAASKISCFSSSALFASNFIVIIVAKNLPCDFEFRLIEFQKALCAMKPESITLNVLIPLYDLHPASASAFVDHFRCVLLRIGKSLSEAIKVHALYLPISVVVYCIKIVIFDWSALL